MGLAAGAVAAIRHLKQRGVERERHQERAAGLRQRLAQAGLPIMPSPSHIVPVMVGDPGLCKAASDELLHRHRIYVQPINFPTVPRGPERLRLSASPQHHDNDIEARWLRVCATCGPASPCAGQPDLTHCATAPGSGKL
jgi:5-aminolevulinate synthase